MERFPKIKVDRIFMLNKKGQSLLEVILAIMIFGLLCSALVTMSLGGFVSLKQGGEYTEAEAYAQQGVEGIRAIQGSAWNKLTVTSTAVTSTGNVWSFVGENTSSTLGIYSRSIVFANVCRDVSNSIITCPGSYTDLNTKQATVTVTWLSTRNAVNTIQKITYLTNWNSRDWAQTDWSGGTGQSIWSLANKYNSDDSNLDYSTSGEIKLKNSGYSCGVKNWTFDTASDYTYDSAKIVVTSSLASLKGTTATTSLDANTMGMWHLDEASGTVIDFTGNHNDLSKVTGAPLYNQSGKFGTSLQFSGNSAVYINNDQQVGLGITGAITIDAWIYRTAAAVTNEAIISKWRETGKKRAYALSVGSDNRLNFWVSSDGAASINTAAVSAIPLNQWVHVAGVYDGAKIYVFQNGTLESSIIYTSGISNQSSFVSVSGADNFSGGNAFFNGKIDEARISNTARWTASFSVPTLSYGSSVTTYPSDNPTINPNAANNVTSIDFWSGFVETATKNGGEIYYQLSDNGGTTWKYWSGSAWATSTLATHYNTASVVNTNIGTFTTSTKQIVFKAFLSGSGSQQVVLDNVQVSCERQYDWTFTTAGDYTYDSSKIAVTGGTASLVDQGGGGSCGGTASLCTTFVATSTCQAQGGCSWGGSASGATINGNFTTNATGWTYVDWTDTAAKATGAYQASGGNTGGYINLTLATSNNTTVSGYWQQPFTTTAANPVGTLSFDWRVPTYSGTGLTSFILYVFVDSAAGAPTIGSQVWSQTITGNTNWANVSNINISSKILTAGTYYLKMAARRITVGGAGGNNITGFDNIQLNWSKASFCSGTATACNTYASSTTCSAQGGCSWAGAAVYPTSYPSVYPTTVYAGSNINDWAFFTETATKNTGEIYYQLSSDGSTWQYWNGSAWVTAGASNYNTASVINSNIATFPTSTGNISFKAFLYSAGSQQVTLDNVRVGWGESAGGGYATAGTFMSSAYNMTKASPVQILSWDQNVSGCSSCNIQMQVRTAPNSGGSPGVWSSWYGASGTSTYFTNYLGSLLPAVLNGNQWVQYQVNLAGDGTGTPILQEVRVNYK